MKRPGRPHGSLVERAIAFALWAAAHAKPPTVEEIRDHLGVSNVQARVWRQYYLNCLPVPGQEFNAPAATGQATSTNRS